MRTTTLLAVTVLIAACQADPGTRMLTLGETLRIDCDVNTPVNGYNDLTCQRAKQAHADQLRQAAAAPPRTPAPLEEILAPSTITPDQARGGPRCAAIPGDKLGGCYPYMTLPGGYRQIIVPSRPRDYPLPMVVP